MNTEVTGSSVTLSWNKVDEATAYNVYVGNDETFENAKQVTSTCSTAISAALPENPGTYFYFVESVRGDMKGNVARSDALMIPDAPSDIVASLEGGHVTVEWSDAIGAESYDVYVATDDTPGKDDLVEVKSDASSGYTATLEDRSGTSSYYYFVESVNGDLRALSEASNVVKFAVPPTAPMEIKATVDGDQVHLDWTDVDDATSYQIYDGLSESFDNADPIGEVTETSFVAALPEHQGLHYYFVRAVRDDVLSAPTSASILLDPNELP